jgi:uncharacterized protein YjaG (DUF416 family)
MKNVKEKFEALVDKMQLFDLYTMNPRDEVALALDELKEAITQTEEIETKQISITVTKYYSKTATFLVDVDTNLVGDSLTEYLRDDEDIDSIIEASITNASLDSNGDDNTYEFQDPTDNNGGHF